MAHAVKRLRKNALPISPDSCAITSINNENVDPEDICTSSNKSIACPSKQVGCTTFLLHFLGDYTYNLFTKVIMANNDNVENLMQILATNSAVEPMDYNHSNANIINEIVIPYNNDHSLLSNDLNPSEVKTVIIFHLM